MLMHNTHHAMSIFLNIIDDDIISNMVEQTNLYSVQKSSVSVCTSVEEKEKFVSIHIMKGIIKVPQVHLYWQEYLNIPYISDVMSRNRFLKPLNNLHLNNNTNMTHRGSPDHDILFKVRPLVDALRRKVQPEEYNNVEAF